MSALTSCNYCTLRDMKQRGKKAGIEYKTVRDSWGGMWPEGVKVLTRKKGEKEWQDAGHRFGALTDHCVC